MGDGNRFERGRAMSLEGSTPSPSAVPVAERPRHRSSKPDRRVRLPPGTLSHVLRFSFDPGQLRLVVTPRSERGGRWFDPSPRNPPSFGEQALGRSRKHDAGFGSSWVEVSRVQLMRTWLGRLIGKAVCLRSRRLRVRIPPGPLDLLSERRIRLRGAAGSARHPVKVEIVGSNPIGGADRQGIQMRRLGIGVPKWL